MTSPSPALTRPVWSPIDDMTVVTPRSPQRRFSISAIVRDVSASVKPPGERMPISNSLWSSWGRNVFPTILNSGTDVATTASEIATITQRCRSDHARSPP